MSQPDNLGSFIRENKTLARNYVETRTEILRLQGIRVLSKSMGLLAWVIIAALLGFLTLIFAGLVLGFWLSDLTDSYVKGFGLTTGVLMLLLVLLVLFREQLFVNPIIRRVIERLQEDRNETEAGDSEENSSQPIN
ncbi:MAG: hypothetical protein P0Y53_06170 [Candidatus Pseudobacter hemicellulosilyticus]|uniref:Phage holin family protein n=1 Tax=Candidatus Pseudobacter hemicellulosilyticus TaxID=3121375 RepID=A0AAJ5WU03_9BACT|nr:MAG: hypothetical protein P0Y53_06170 [Pseudobacter sp.]